MTPDAQTKPEDVQADGYYGDDDMSSDELDLSFLDEDESTDKK
jgi:hypothetical protein